MEDKKVQGKNDRLAESEEERFKRLMATIFYICENAGFHIEERIVIRDRRTGRVWR